MKKYLKLLFVALFATMTFAFTACGDDDDEPDGGNNNKGVVGELTVDGKLVQFYYIISISGEDSVTDGWSASAYSKTGSLDFHTWGEDITKFRKGEDLTDVFTITNLLGNSALIGLENISGKVILKDIDSKYVTISFENVTVDCLSTTTTFTVDGTIKLPINGELGSIFNYN